MLIRIQHACSIGPKDGRPVTGAVTLVTSPCCQARKIGPVHAVIAAAPGALAWMATAVARRCRWRRVGSASRGGARGPRNLQEDKKKYSG